LAIKDGQTKRDSFCAFQVFWLFLVLKSLTNRQVINYYE